jgi:alpha-amylase/alpha-mannosidase (GH57 family)
MKPRTYVVEFFTKGGYYPLAKSLKDDGIEYTITENIKSKTTKTWTLEWKQ